MTLLHFRESLASEAYGSSSAPILSLFGILTAVRDDGSLSPFGAVDTLAPFMRPCLIILTYLVDNFRVRRSVIAGYDHSQGVHLQSVSSLRRCLPMLEPFSCTRRGFEHIQLSSSPQQVAFQLEFSVILNPPQSIFLSDLIDFHWLYRFKPVFGTHGHT